MVSALDVDVEKVDNESTFILEELKTKKETLEAEVTHLQVRTIFVKLMMAQMGED